MLFFIVPKGYARMRLDIEETGRIVGRRGRRKREMEEEESGKPAIEIEEGREGAIRIEKGRGDAMRGVHEVQVASMLGAHVEDPFHSRIQLLSCTAQWNSTLQDASAEICEHYF